MSVHRIFIVGYPRSGTTLLQSVLGAHRDLTTFTETHLFVVALRPRRWYRPLHLRRKKIRARAETLLMKNGLEHLLTSQAMRALERIDRQPFVRGKEVAWAIIDLLDAMAASRQHAKGWVEKTPRHLYYCDLIAKAYPGVQFVHIARRGQDAVASVVKAGPQWEKGGLYAKRARAARLWNAEMRRSLRFSENPAHHFVTYEDLVDHTQSNLQRLFSALGLPPDPQALDRYREIAKMIVRGDEIWKRRNLEPIGRQSTSRSVLGDEGLEEVRSILRRELYSAFDALCGKEGLNSTGRMRETA